MLTTSIFFAVMANVSLICRFLERGPVLVTTLIAMASLTVHGKGSFQSSILDSFSSYVDVINTIAVVTFGAEHNFDDGFTYGHGYWMTGVSSVPRFFIVLTDKFSMFH
jgi:hypothetical protein